MHTFGDSAAGAGGRRRVNSFSESALRAGQGGEFLSGWSVELDQQGRSKCQTASVSEMVGRKPSDSKPCHRAKNKISSWSSVDLSDARPAMMATAYFSPCRTRTRSVDRVSAADTDTPGDRTGPAAALRASDGIHSVTSCRAWPGPGHRFESIGDKVPR
jgi:hypothetical protein